MDRNLAAGEVGGKKARPVTSIGAKGYESSSGSSDEEYCQASEELSANIAVHMPKALHKYAKLRVFDKPMCMIYSDKNNIPRFEKSVVAELKKIDLPMVIVGIAGLYRTGKSYLLNIIADEKIGFQTGDSVLSTTKGIWVWCMMHPRQKDTVLVLLDTEGLGDVQKDVTGNNDLTMFTLVTLLCNVLIYNMEGVFDQSALTKLEMYSTIKLDGKCNNQNLHMVLPSFALVLRNFTKKLLGKKGTVITADTYLENALENSEEKSETYNETRESIKKCFQTRRCFTLPPPGDIDLIEQLENISLSETCKRFQTNVSEMRDYIYSEQTKRLVINKPVNGSVFANLVRGFVKNIAKGGTSDVDATYTRAAQRENQKVGTVASSIFKQHMESVTLPMKRKELDQECSAARHAAFQHVFDHSVLDGINGNIAFNVVKEEVEVLWKEIEETNGQLLKEKCTRILKQCSKYSTMKERVKSKCFRTEEGIHELRDICLDIEREYNEKLASFEDHERLPVWQKFAKEMAHTESEILDAMEQSRKLSEANYEKERLQKEQQQEREIARCKERLFEGELANIAEQMKDLREREAMRARAEIANMKNTALCRLM